MIQKLLLTLLIITVCTGLSDTQKKQTKLDVPVINSGSGINSVGIYHFNINQVFEDKTVEGPHTILDWMNAELASLAKRNRQEKGMLLLPGQEPYIEKVRGAFIRWGALTYKEMQAQGLVD